MSSHSLEEADATGRAFAEHWTWAAEKGLMNANTARSVRAACTQVLGAFPGWETMDVRRLDLADLFRRFQNKRGKDFVPESLETYQRRFTLAHASFLEFLAHPGAWKSPFRERALRGLRPRGKTGPAPAMAMPGAFQTTAGKIPQALPVDDFLDYPFPLLSGKVARLHLPADLTKTDAARLQTFIASLAIDAGKE